MRSWYLEKKVSLLERVKLVVSQLDVVGLTLLGAAVALILLPLTLAQNAKGQWNNRAYHSPSSHFFMFRLLPISIDVKLNNFVVQRR